MIDVGTDNKTHKILRFDFETNLEPKALLEYCGILKRNILFFSVILNLRHSETQLKLCLSRHDGSYGPINTGGTVIRPCNCEQITKRRKCLKTIKFGVLMSCTVQV